MERLGTSTKITRPKAVSEFVMLCSGHARRERELMPLSPYVSQILAECPDARLILAHPDGSGRFTLLSVSETAATAEFLAANGVLIAGAVGTGLGGTEIVAAAEPGHGEMVGRARLAAILERAAGADFFSPQTKIEGDSVSWLERLHKLEDTRGKR